MVWSVLIHPKMLRMMEEYLVVVTYFYLP